MVRFVTCALVFGWMVAIFGQEPPRELLTRPERSEWKETSSLADITDFLAALGKTQGAARFSFEELGRTALGRVIPLIHVPPKNPGNAVRVFVIGDIHGGEVEGKEALQILLREIALSQHDEVLVGVDLYVVPVFNADGNALIDVSNRVSQNGPSAGVGQRANAQGLDLNRDFLKVESPEVRALIRAFRTLDPEVFIDLHTTNGSMHGYHLTYAPSCATNVDSGLDQFTRNELLSSLRTEVEKRHGYRTFDYGNFSQRGPLRWTTFSPDPRLGFNYGGLRNRISLLFEAYSYRDFQTRILTTRACLIETLRFVSAKRDRVRALCESADARTRGTLPGGARELTFDPELVITKGKVWKATVDEVPWPDGRGDRHVVRDDHQEVEAEIAVAFRGKDRRPWPDGWAIVNPPAKVVENLLVHGVTLYRLDGGTRLAGTVFTIGKRSKSPRVFQGHQLVRLRGTYSQKDVELPAGTIIVPSHQRLARLAANLLSPSSDDSLITWNFFDAVLGEGAEGTIFPVIELARLPDLPAPVVATEETLLCFPFPRAAPEGFVAKAVIAINNVEKGVRQGASGFESAVGSAGRVTRYDYDGVRGVDLLGFIANVTARGVPADGGLLLSIGPGVDHEEIVNALNALNAAGIHPDHLRLH